MPDMLYAIRCLHPKNYSTTSTLLRTDQEHKGKSKKVKNSTTN